MTWGYQQGVTLVIGIPRQIRFIDDVSMELDSGRGGDGCVSFRHEPKAPKGGPDGGDGGRGGDVWVECDESLTSLAHLRSLKRVCAQNGEHGTARQKKGKDGEGAGISVPPGTRVYEQGIEPRRLLSDLVRQGQTCLVAEGGKGGKGNARLKSASDRAPTRFVRGQLGRSVQVALDLRLMAEVGLVGLPNSGKSSLTERLSLVPQRVEPYAFTTTVPKQVVFPCSEWETRCLLDMPPLTEGASRGAGLGNAFLKHIDRCRLLFCVVDLSVEPRPQIEILLSEMRAFGEWVLEKPLWIIGNKMDSPGASARCRAMQGSAEGHGFLGVSCKTGAGIDHLKERLCRTLAFPI